MIDCAPYIRQGAPPHGPMKLGSGRRTIAQAGCLLSCLVMAARALTPNKKLTVLGAHGLIVDSSGFVGSSLKVPVAAKALGMRFEERAELRDDAIMTDLAEGRPVIVGVDYKPGASSGFSDCDHFALAIEYDAGALHVVDPATGTLERLALKGTTYSGKGADLAEMIRLGRLDQ
jgi:hypothetical protein